MSTENFYKNIPSFCGFNGITSQDNFQSMPGDWKVIITDVKGSTNALPMLTC